MKTFKLPYFLLLFFVLNHLVGCKSSEPEQPDDPKIYIYGSFDSKFNRYQQGQKHRGQTDQTKIIAHWSDTVWRNDRIHKQLVLWASGGNSKALSIQISDLTNVDQIIPSTSINIRYVSYVEGDAEGKVCGKYPAYRSGGPLIGDALSTTAPAQSLSEGGEPLKLWLTANIPPSTHPGTYKGEITVKSNDSIQQRFSIEFLVTNQELPAVADWSFHLDIWQFPFQLPLLCKVVPFSDNHYQLLEPFYRLLADAGQCSISTYIKDGAFNPGQTMVKWIRKKDGSWHFDYTNFDQYVEKMMQWGIDKQINCFSLLGWNPTRIGYHDEATAKNMIYSFTDIQSEEFHQGWDHFLTLFRAHLIDKGWFSKTVLYMDENIEEEMKTVIRIIKSNDSQWKIGLAGRYVESIEKDLYDYCTLLGYNRQIATNNPIATFYTSCAQAVPNNYVTQNNNPAEMPWMAWHAKAKGLNGYLRWAYDYWTKSDPKNVQDGSNAAGDFSFVYRLNNSMQNQVISSIRLELLREGIQYYEKIRILNLPELNTMVTEFATVYSGYNAASVVTKGEALVKRLSTP